MTMTAEKYSEAWLRDKMSRNKSQRRGSTVFWMSTIKDGKLHILGWKATEDEAYTYCYQNCGGRDFQVTPLDTTDTDRAARFLKGKILSETHDLDVAMQKMVHDDKKKGKRK
ncbi:MAG: hypothetical protein WC822_06130 [Candidatus Paceibacterota bacterium]|jgi:hypothetical protein